MRRTLLGLAVFAMSGAPGASNPETVSTISYTTGDGGGLWFEVRSRPGQRTEVDMTQVDTRTGPRSCSVDPGYVCVEMGWLKSLVFAVPRDLRHRIPETTVVEMDTSKKLTWTAAGFEYRAWVPTDVRVSGGTPVWGPVGFAGQDISAIRIDVYQVGKSDGDGLDAKPSLSPDCRNCLPLGWVYGDKRAATFLYNPEHGVLAFEYPYGSESGGIELHSYWLENKCGLIPIEPCHEVKGR